MSLRVCRRLIWVLPVVLFLGCGDDDVVVPTDTGIDAPTDGGIDAPVHVPPACPPDTEVAPDTTSCPSVDPALAGGLVVSELTVTDPSMTDPPVGASDIADFMWTYSPIPRIHITVSAPMLPPGEAATVPVEFGVVPVPPAGTHYTQAELDARYCPIGTVYLAGVTNVPTVHEITELPMPNECFAAGTPILRDAWRRNVPSDAVPDYTTYYVNLALQPRPCDPAAPESGVVPRTYFTDVNGSTAADRVAMHPECTTTSTEPGATGCVWDMAVWPVTTAAEVRPDELTTQSCVATVWTDIPTDGMIAQEPFARTTLSVTAYGQAVDVAGRTSGGFTHPFLVEYFVEPTRLSMPSGDRGERLRVAAHDDATLTDADTALALSDFVFDTSEPHDHVLYLTDAARARILGGDWASDEMFTLTGCIAADATTPPTDRDCKSHAIIVDRAPPPSGVARQDPGGAGGPGDAPCGLPGQNWRLAPVDITESRGDARLLQFDLTAKSIHAVSATSLQTTNELTVNATALSGIFRRSLVDAHANGCAQVTPTGATLTGDVRVIAFGIDFLAPMPFTDAFSFAGTPYGTPASFPPGVTFVVFVVPVTISFSGSGMWGWRAGSINWGDAGAPDPEFDARGYDQVFQLDATPAPFASVNVGATATVRVPGMSASLAGTVNLLSVELPASARVQVGTSSTSVGLAARFQASANRTMTIGGGQVIASYSAFWFSGRKTMFTLPPLVSRTDTLFTYATPPGSLFTVP